MNFKHCVIINDIVFMGDDGYITVVPKQRAIDQGIIVENLRVITKGSLQLDKELSVDLICGVIRFEDLFLDER